MRSTSSIDARVSPARFGGIDVHFAGTARPAAGGWSGPRSALLDPRTVKALSRPSIARGLWAVARQWLVIAACIAAGQLSDSWIVTILAIVLIATRQHALLVLMHDAAHYLLARNRMANDVIANLCLTFPLMISTARYREHHLQHHRRVNEADDPDLGDSTCPDRVSGLLLLFLQDLTLLSTMKSLRSMTTFSMFGALSSRAVPARDKILFVAFLAATAATLTLTQSWILLAWYWLLPMATVLPFLLRVRALSEHAGRIGAGLLSHARTIDVGPIERVIFAPCHINRHLEHHLFPSVPNQNLEALARALRRNAIFAAEAPVTRGYLRPGPSLLRELYPRAATASSGATGARQ